MAKSSKVEDYWRQHNIESLFKELTQILVRRMPSDPVIAIVEHLQKKFPKSFKTTSVNNFQTQSLTSPHSDLHNDSFSGIQNERRSSNQSQISGIITLPTTSSAFTNLLKSDPNILKPAPEISLKNLVFANRLSQQAIKMAKDIRSDHDILEEEFIKPSTIKSITKLDSISEDSQHIEIHEESTVPQLIKYKQQIRTENDRRLHRERLAELAKYQREREQFIQLDSSVKLQEIPQEKLDDDHDYTLSHAKSIETTNTQRLSHKPVAQSKEEEDILNDENVFQCRKHRERTRQKTLRTNIHGQHLTNLQLMMKKDGQNSTCKLCGHILHKEDSQTMISSTAASVQSLQPQVSSQSVETTGGTVDDWFESASNVSATRQPSPWATDDITPPPTGSSTFRRSLFQPINDTVEHRPPRSIISPENNQIKTKRSITPRMSETGLFGRSPETNIPRPSSSPVTKRHQTDSISKTLTTERRMSGWSVSEHAPDDSDEN